MSAAPPPLAGDSVQATALLAHPAPAAVPARLRRVAILGNPNTGKSTLFNALTGLKARVANYPGVTVEKKIGSLGPGVELIDLPGTYSLAAHSPDELVAVQVLHGDMAGEPRPDLVVVIADASNLPRNLFLTTQVLEMGLPVIVALNMVDAAARAGIEVNVAKLSTVLGVPVVATVASRNLGIEELRKHLLAEQLPVPPRPGWAWPAPIEAEIAVLTAELRRDRFEVVRALVDAGGALEQHLAEYRPAGSADGTAAVSARGAIEAARARLTAAGVVPAKAEAQMRYAWIAKTVQPCITRSAAAPGADLTDRLDNLLTHRLYGSLIFIALMTLVFVSIFLLAQPVMEWIDAGFAWLGTWAEGLFAGSALEGGMFQSMVVDGAIPGVGGVFVFLPQIAFLFLFIAILEDSGYMARAAFLMDRVLRFCGLSGHSFIPMMSSFACAIPGLMATRTIANPRDRLTTILVAPLMSCSARIPVYGLLCAAFVPSEPLHGMLPGLVFAGMYFVGIFTAVPVAWLLKKTLLKGPPPPFVLELPQYRLPIWSNVGLRVWEASKAFTIRAGTAIFAISLILWALLYFPHARAVGDKYDPLRPPIESQMKPLEAQIQPIAEQMKPILARIQPVEEQMQPVRAQILALRSKALAAPAPEDSARVAEVAALQKRLDDLQTQLDPWQAQLAPWKTQFDPLQAQLAELQAQLDTLDRLEKGDYLRDSLLGRLGHAIEPAVQPLGWDWRIGVAALASFPAREVVVSTLRIIYDLGGEEAEGEDGVSQLTDQLKASTWPDGRKVFTLPVALSIMVFFALCAQCAATLVTVKKESGSWKWAAFTFVYMTGLAYVGALLTFQVGTALLAQL